MRLRRILKDHRGSPTWRRWQLLLRRCASLLQYARAFADPWLPPAGQPTPEERSTPSPRRRISRWRTACGSKLGVADYAAPIPLAGAAAEPARQEPLKRARRPRDARPLPSVAVALPTDPEGKW